ncbi:MAG TPA: alpha amylase C-terminal domain-containing protein [Bryobacteraceae bacterium]|nr:alpha amylase C-terminal domain-containing protein [Bryobacteraceae bacterium]
MQTPMGANLVEGGATFRVWAPRARDVYVVAGAEAAASREPGWTPRLSDRLTRREDGTWALFVPGLKEGAPYRFYVVGDAGGGFKRDPYARELGIQPAFPDCDCLVRDPTTYPWHDSSFHAPAFNDLIIYQLHVGAFYGVDAQGRDKREQVADFLDVITRIPYLRDLGVTAIQLLPVQEFPFDTSLGYNNVDFFSPEMAYQVDDIAELNRYLPAVNALLSEQGAPPLTLAQLEPGPNQLKTLIDLLHMNGIAVIFDLVYNHAGGGFDDHCLYFFDMQNRGDNRDSLYFTNSGWAGGLVFNYQEDGVRDFLIQNARFFLEEYHADGIRYDEVSVIDNHGGWFFCQDLTNTLHFVKPEAIHIAEYWNSRRELAVQAPPAGMGFDAALADGLRERLREAVGQAAGGASADVNLYAVRDALYPPYGFNEAWRAVNCLENHDIVYSDREPEEWRPRLAKLADWNNPRSWYARSRSRFATSILLTAPGIPMLFMGQEILEDKNWSDNPAYHKNTLVWWEGLEQDPAMRDFLAFTRALIRLRRDCRALRGPNVNGYHVNHASRVIAFHRWMDWSGEDVIVAGTLSEGSLYDYRIGFPQAGAWREIFNSDFFESSAGHRTTGNEGAVAADGPPLHGMPASARITIPANGVVVFTR